MRCQHVGLYLVTAVAITTYAACQPGQTIDNEPAPAPDLVLPGMFDQAAAYHRMGFLAKGAPVPFVGAVRFLAGPGADSTLALFSASLANNALSFRRADAGFEAGYRIDVVIDVGGSSHRISSSETVRVSGFAETQR